MVVITNKGNLHVKDSLPGRFLPITNGPMLVRALRIFQGCSTTVRLVLILPQRRRSF